MRTREAMFGKALTMQNFIEGTLAWEEKWKRMETEQSGAVPVSMKISAYLQVCPKEVQSVIGMNMEDVEDDFVKLRNRIVN